MSWHCTLVANIPRVVGSQKDCEVMQNVGYCMGMQRILQGTANLAPKIYALYMHYIKCSHHDPLTPQPPPGANKTDYPILGGIPSKWFSDKVSYLRVSVKPPKRRVLWLRFARS